MNSVDRNWMRWKNLKQWLGFKGMARIGCCGAAWSSSASTITIIQRQHREDDDFEYDDHEIHMAATGQLTLQQVIDHEDHLVLHHPPRLSAASPLVAAASNAPPGMNLAMALAAERNMRSACPTAEDVRAKTLMRLIEETEGVDWTKKQKKKWRNVGEGGEGGTGRGNDSVCCVCMDRKKGAAFIPCGHTFCRVCSRELWVNRGTCPICNRPIIEILDIF